MHTRWRARQASTPRNRDAYNSFQHHRRTMRGNLNNIFSGVGIGRLKMSYNRFVEALRMFSVFTLRIENVRPLRVRVYKWF